MLHFFTTKFESDDQVEEYLYNIIAEYVDKTKVSVNTLGIIRYISVLRKYILETEEKKNQNLRTLISFIEGSLSENEDILSETENIFTEYLSHFPDNFLGINFVLTYNELEPEDFYEMLLIIKFNILDTISYEVGSGVSEATLLKKHKKEIDALNKAIKTAEECLDTSSEESLDLNAPTKLPDKLREKIEQFLKDYKPNKIKEYLDKYIIGQEEAKRTVSVAVYNHMLLLVHPELELKKNNLLMIGPSGCGKTEIIRVLSNILPVPISIFDTSGMSQNGWKGDKKVKDAVKELLIKTEDIASAEGGIIFLDEFDKMCRPAFTSNGENVSVHIQGEILAMIEGTSVEVSLGNDDFMGLTKLINTKNILFICAGAFQGIEDIVKKEKNKDVVIGFNSASKDSSEITAKDINKEIIMKFGVTPELAGRLSITTVLHKLTREDMFNIITKCENNVLDELKNIARTGYGIEVEITENALLTLIDKLCLSVGARGIRSIIFEEFTNIFFEVSCKENLKKVVLDDNLIAKYIDKK